MPAGQPTSYKEEYCEMLIEHMSKGFSFRSFAGVVDVCADTIYEWCKQHSKFSDAKSQGEEKSRLFYEGKGLEGLFSTSETEREGNSSKTSSKSLNTQAWLAMMRVRFHEYNEHLFKEKSKEEEKQEPPSLVINVLKN